MRPATAPVPTRSVGAAFRTAQMEIAKGTMAMIGMEKNIRAIHFPRSSCPSANSARALGDRRRHADARISARHSAFCPTKTLGIGRCGATAAGSAVGRLVIAFLSDSYDSSLGNYLATAARDCRASSADRIERRDDHTRPTLPDALQASQIARQPKVAPTARRARSACVPAIAETPPLAQSSK